MNWVLVLGVVTGLRAMTGIAVVCWAAWLALIPERGWAIWTSYLVSALVFTALALGEYVGDTLPRTPSRKTLVPALSRLVFGGLVGALGATAIEQPLAGGILLGIVGAAVGTWGGYTVRMFAARQIGRDRPAALVESALALLLAMDAAWQLHQSIAFDLSRGAF